MHLYQCIFCLTLGILLDGVYSAMKWPNPKSTWPYDSSQPPGVTKNPGLLSSGKSAYAEAFNDQLWKNQWYGHDYRGITGPMMDHNFVPVYMSGINGKGVKISVLAEGKVDNHPDLVTSDAPVVYKDDYKENIPDEMVRRRKRYAANAMQAHGVLTMLSNNTKCGVGIAWGAQVTHVELAWEATADKIPAALASTEADIYQTIWRHDAIDFMDLKANADILNHLREASLKGRSGKGSIFVVDVGSSKRYEETCAVDHMANSVHTISIAAANQNGKVTGYSERCAGVFATAYSGDRRLEGIVTTNTGASNDFTCQTNGNGTALAATLATGMFALVLQANPGLTYRDVQHIVAVSAEVAPLADNPHSWRQNKAGFWLSYDFGFGLLNAENMVRLARFWKAVPELHTCEMKFLERSALSPGQEVSFKQDSDGCEHDDDDKAAVKFLEQVELVVTFNYYYRGAIRIELTSPSGTETNMLQSRPEDENDGGLSSWRIRSLHYWGEVARGPWKLKVIVNRYSKGTLGEIIALLIHNSKLALTNQVWGSYEISNLKLIMHGTLDKPYHYQTPSPYRKNYSIFTVDKNTLPH